MTKAKRQINKVFLSKVISVLVVIALVIVAGLIISKNNLKFSNEKNQHQEQMTALQQKVDTLHHDLRTAISNKQIETQQPVNPVQIKDAYLLVRTAATCLKNDHDVEVAKQLLQLASEHLAGLQGPKIDHAKSMLAADQIKLNAVVVPDKRLVQDKLDVLGKLVNILPSYVHSNNATIVMPSKVTPCDNTWYQPLCHIFADLTSVITVRKRTEPVITVTDIDIVRAQIRLLIEQMRWAALYNNADVYHRSLQSIQELLPKAFDMNSDSVHKFVATVNELQKIKFRSDLPDLQDS
ncbi:MAG TPA: uroporphyrinogen-III C-methyltransferase, partial [Gammaproteobacteria bacterium]|nr:uroporphyrinogen-III C-methyltransferase [Gammaproteobacteria bacterium]